MPVHFHARLLFLWSVSCGHLARDFRRLFVPWRLALQSNDAPCKSPFINQLGPFEYMVHSLAMSYVLLHWFLQLKLSGVCCCTFLTTLRHGRPSPLGLLLLELDVLQPLSCVCVSASTGFCLACFCRTLSGPRRPCVARLPFSPHFC